MDHLLLCRLHDVFACVVTAMDPIRLCYLHYAKDPILLCYLHSAFLCVVLCFCMWVYLRSAYKHKYARDYAELIMWNEIRENQVRQYEDRETHMKEIHDETLDFMMKLHFKSENDTANRLLGKIKSLKSELGDLRHDRDKLLLDWADQVKHAKVHAWVPELLPTSQAGSP
jgi:hypothetical protein